TGALVHPRSLAAQKKTPADQATYWVGMSLLRLKKYAEAETTFVAGVANYKDSPRAPDMQLGLADALMAQKKYVAAAEAFKAYALKWKKSEQAPRALYFACVAYHNSGDKYAESDTTCAEFLKTFPNDSRVPLVLFLSGENRFLQEKHNEAATRYNEFLKVKDAPKDRVPRAHFRLAWIHYFGKKYDAAVAEIAKIDAAAAGEVITSESNYLKGVCLFELEKYAESVAAMAAYMKAKDTSRYGEDALLKMGVSQVKTDKRADAAKTFELLISKFSKSKLLVQARYRLGECYQELKQYPKAIENYKKVGAVKPPDELSSFALFGVGQCYYEQQKWAESAAAFGVMAKAFPKTDLAPQALYHQGRSLQKLKKWPEAQQAFSALVAGYAKDKLARGAQVAVGICLQEQKKWGEAAAAYKKVIDDWPEKDDQVRIYYELAWSLRTAGKESEALAVFKIIAEKYPTHQLAADANFHLGEERYKWTPPKPKDPKAKPVKEDPKARVKRYDIARGFYEKALIADKKKSIIDKAYYRIGWCHWFNKKFKEAGGAFDKLLKEAPNSNLVPDALFQGGQSYARAKQPALAIDRLTLLVGNQKYQK
ncbi:MAG: tetratricopeptide repeat protein, partial [Planctomycetia bacterium]|nr:tetratricopeptide repeat protein [Planctomycetia bacterium]